MMNTYHEKGIEMETKKVKDSEIVLSQLMQPEHANNLGNIHGGVLMKLMDEAGGMCATRHARAPAVTVAVDSLTFLEPVHIGDLVTFSARITFVGRTSIETEVVVEAEEIFTGKRRITNRAYIVYVALSGEGHPVEVPRLTLETDEERERWNQGERRQKDRLERRI